VFDPEELLDLLFDFPDLLLDLALDFSSLPELESLWPAIVVVVKACLVHELANYDVVCRPHPDRRRRFRMRSINRLRNIFEYFFKYCDPRLNLQPTSQRHSSTHVPAWRRYRGGSYSQAQDDVLEGLKQPLYNISSSPSKVIRRKRHPRWASSIRLPACWGAMIPPLTPDAGYHLRIR
jgi:hypothetical protein